MVGLIPTSLNITEDKALNLIAYLLVYECVCLWMWLNEYDLSVRHFDWSLWLDMHFMISVHLTYSQRATKLSSTMQPVVGYQSVFKVIFLKSLMYSFLIKNCNMSTSFFEKECVIILDGPKNRKAIMFNYLLLL